MLVKGYFFICHNDKKEKENTATVIILTIIQYIQISGVELEIPRVMLIDSGELWQTILFWILQLHP